VADDWSAAYGIERARSARLAAKAKEWEAYAHRLEAELAGLRQSLGEWQAGVGDRDKAIGQYKAAIATRDAVLQKRGAQITELQAQLLSERVAFREADPALAAKLQQARDRTAQANRQLVADMQRKLGL